LYEPRLEIKAQVLADFLAEMTHPGESYPGEWTIYIDGSLNTKGCGAGATLENIEGVAVEYSLRFKFLTSTNQAEDEVCLAGIRMAKELGATVVTICSDSRLIVSQIK
jgi:ribonuclease HI